MLIAALLGILNATDYCHEWARYALVGANSQDSGRPLILKPATEEQIAAWEKGIEPPKDAIYFWRGDISDEEVSAEWDAVQEGYAWSIEKQKEGFHAWQMPDGLVHALLQSECLTRYKGIL